MKFSDGFWRMRPGVTAWHPVEAYDVCESLDALTIYAPTRRIEHRGHTLGGPLVTIRLSSPLPDVVGVRLTHFEGEVPQKPEFPLATAPGPVVVSATDEAAELTAGRLTVRVGRDGEWRIDFEADGRVLTSSEPKGIGIVETEGHHYMVEQLGLGVGECVYGLGERFGPLVKNGQSVDIWNQDGGTSSEQAYKNIPFYLTNRGLRRVREPPRPGLLRGRLGGRLPRPVQRPGPRARVLRHLRPEPEGDPREIHRPHRPAGPAAGLVVRALAEHVLHHRVRRADGDELHPGHGRARPPAARLPLRLVLDARVQLVRLRVGPAHVSRSAGHARPAEGGRAAGSACGSTPTSPSAPRCSRRGAPAATS